MTYMKILLLLMFCTVLPMQAQQMKKLTDLKDFEARLLQEAKNIESIESNFTQIKYLDVFDEKITSKGTFYYKKSNKICMDYAQPMNYLIVINNNQLKIVSDGKKSIMDLHSNKMMNQMQDMLTACMVGDLSNMSLGYALEYFEDTHYYLIQIKPVSKAVKAYINQIQIYLDKKDMSVHKLRLSETATNYTEYEFSDKKFNSLKDEAKFTIR
ncbi:outer membrane lipoprotein carrier protein LolA [Phocaeicola vulgatus]|nr:outer membrane lipoprotein carrier protein LolA [Phocaeicola vulgatus]